MAELDERTRALDEIAAIARRHGISALEIAAAIGGQGAPGHRARGVLVRVLGFLGGTFVFAGVGIFIAMRWSDLNAAARVVVTLGPGVTAFVLASLGARDPRFEKSATPLFLIAAALEPTGMFVAFDEFGSGGDWRVASLVTSATMALQFAATFQAIRRSVPLFMTILFGTLFWGTALDLLDVAPRVIGLALGASVLVAAIGIDRTLHRDISPPWYLVGSVAFLAALFETVDRTPFEVLFVAAAVGGVYLSAVLRSRMLLFVATMAILGYTAWFTSERFADSVGWPIALIIFGMFMIGLSAFAFRIDREYVRAPGHRPA